MKRIAQIVLVVIVAAAAIFIIPNWHADKSVEELTPLLGSAPSKWIQLESLNVHYRDQGEGPVLVLLHGTAANLHTWEGWVQALSPHYRIIRPDLPAFGLTGPLQDRTYTPARYAAFVEEFTTALGLDSFSLAGNSLGGRIAWEYALKHPEKLNSLILLDASGFPSDAPDPMAFKMARTPVVNKLMNRLTPKSLVRKSLLDVYHNDALVTDSLVNMYFNTLLREGNRQAFTDRVNGESGDMQDVDKLTSLKMPVLVQWGTHDSWIPVAHATEFQNKIPHAEVILYDNAGHIPMEEIPEQSAMDAHKFIRATLLPQSAAVSLSQ